MERLKPVKDAVRGLDDLTRGPRDCPAAALVRQLELLRDRCIEAARKLQENEGRTA